MLTNLISGRIRHSIPYFPTTTHVIRLLGSIALPIFPRYLVLFGLALFCNTWANASAPRPIAYASSFEEASMAPFWNAKVTYGTIALSKDFAYGGTHSLKFQSSSGGDRFIKLIHSFGSSTQGTVSVAFYDAAPGQETLYEQLILTNSKMPGSSVGVGTMDFDSQCYTAYMVSESGSTTGPNAECGIYPQQSTSPVKRSQGWHILTVATGLSTEISIDGKTVFTGPAYSFDKVTLQVSGPSWRPDTVVYFDDFSFAPYSY